MTVCEGCSKPDQPFYDYRQSCTCGARPHLHGTDKHEAACYRVRHAIKPHLTKLRRVRRDDQFEDSFLLPAPNKADEFARLRREGFRIKKINGNLYSERILCSECIRIWAEREENRKSYEKAKRGGKPMNYYQMICND